MVWNWSRLVFRSSDALPGAGLQTQRPRGRCVGLNCMGMKTPNPNLYHENKNGSNSDSPKSVPMFIATLKSIR